MIHSATISHELADKIAAIVGPLIDGEIRLGHVTLNVDFPMSVTLTIDRAAGELVVTPTNVSVSQFGPDPVLKEARFHRSGRLKAKGRAWGMEAERIIVPGSNQ